MTDGPLLLEVLTRQTTYHKFAIYQVKWNLDLSPKMTCCQWAIVRFFHLCAHYKQRGCWLVVNRGFLVLRVYRHSNHGAGGSCWWFSGQPSFHANSSFTPSRPAQLWSHPVRPSSTKHSLDEVWSSNEPMWTGLASKFQWQHMSGGRGWQ